MLWAPASGALGMALKSNADVAWPLILDALRTWQSEFLSGAGKLPSAPGILTAPCMILLSFSFHALLKLAAKLLQSIVYMQCDAGFAKQRFTCLCFMLPQVFLQSAE